MIGATGPGTPLDDGDPAVARWRILLVEDSADDAELARLELAEAGVDAEYRLVHNEAGLLQALAAFTPHLVLSDMNMPGFCGQRAIELVRAHTPAARFIFLSDATPRPASMLPLGPTADACLRKDDLAQLPALVRAVLGD